MHSKQYKYTISRRSGRQGRGGYHTPTPAHSKLHNTYRISASVSFEYTEAAGQRHHQRHLSIYLIIVECRPATSTCVQNSWSTVSYAPVQPTIFLLLLAKTRRKNDVSIVYFRLQDRLFRVPRTLETRTCLNVCRLRCVCSIWLSLRSLAEAVYFCFGGKPDQRITLNANIR